MFIIFLAIGLLLVFYGAYRLLDITNPIDSLINKIDTVEKDALLEVIDIYANKAKFEAKLKHYNETQQFIDNIILIKGKEKKYKLVDGYTTYLICANTLKQSEVKVDYFE